MNTSDNVDNNIVKPKLSDPKEYAIVKKVYFGDQSFESLHRDDLDPQERFERLNKRIKHSTQQSR